MAGGAGNQQSLDAVKVLVAIVSLLLMVIILGVALRNVPPTAIGTPPLILASPVTATFAPGVSCRISSGLPDPNCTPGASNPDVRQDNIGITICVSGFTTRIRPPASYTTDLKLRQMQAYGLAGTTAEYEEDHLIALELGGHPTDPRNLWPEPRAGEPNAAEKDRLENYLHAAVCAGRTVLADAQHAIATDWFAAWTAAGRP